MRFPLCAVLLTLVVPFSASHARAADAKPDAVRTERLVRLCKVWGTVRYLHPHLAYKDVDWDAALVAALPKVEAARDDQEYGAAVQAMLDRLGDPATRVVRTAPGAQAEPRSNGRGEKQRPLFSWVEDDILTIHLDRSPSLSQLTDPKTREGLLAALKKAFGVIVDLRGPDMTGLGDFVLGWVSPQLPARDVRGPAERFLVHSGYRPQTGFTSGGYFSAFQTTLPQAFRAAPDRKGKRTVFLVGEQTELPSVALALQEAGEAFVVAQGKAGAALGGGRRVLPLADGFQVHVRTTELVGRRGLVRVEPDAVVPAGADRGTKGPAFQKAVGLLREGPKAARPAKAPEGAELPQGAWQPDKRYETMNYPAREYRLLALFRFWNVIHYFYPYKDLLDQDWDIVLPRFVPQFAGAGDALDYALAVAEMATCVQDTHTGVYGSKELSRFFGEAAAPVALRLIEGRTAVTDVLDAEAVKGSGLAVGDVVLAVDGEPVEKRMARYGKYLAGSNPDAHAWAVLRRLLNGPDGSAVKLTVRGKGDKARDVTLPRKAAYAARGPKRGGDVFKILEGNVGYCDLQRLTVGEVDAMLERLKGTRAIVFDLRGYPRGTAWTLAPRLNVKGAKYGASFQRPLVSSGVGGEQEEGHFAFRQPLPPTTQWKYQGKTVTLIDERAISQSEHTGLFLEAACATTFIGSRTAGANGDITSLTLPGGLFVVFTGHDVRHADGRQLQRVGLVPHVEVRPTLAGVRAGEDEVLARALAYLREGK
jgi:C-terminal processing protease CtpA/Prc